MAGSKLLARKPIMVEFRYYALSISSLQLNVEFTFSHQTLSQKYFTLTLFNPCQVL